MNKKISVITKCIIIAAMPAVFSIPAFATGDIASAIESTWTDARTQVEAIVNNVVFPVFDLVLAVLLFISIGSNYFEYRKHGQFDFTKPAILFACLLFTLTAPLYIWTII